jgi:5-methylcytosine-specific restriction endonuclease McrA
MNRWHIPAWLEREVAARDQCCVYCGITFGDTKGSGKSVATWEHIVNDARIINRDNIARCCAACNSSKGNKQLADWLNSPYCRSRGITAESAAGVVRRALRVRP